MITYPRVRMIFMIIGIISTLYYSYAAIGVGLQALVDLGAWLERTFK